MLTRALLLVLLVALAAATTPLTLRVRDGTLLTPPHAGQYVGTYTSQLQRRVMALFPDVGQADYAKTSLVDGAVLRHLYLDGAYLADQPLTLPSLLVLHLGNGTTITDAANLSANPFNGNFKSFPAMVMLNGSAYSAVLGGTVNATAHNATQMMGVGVLDGSRNSVRGVRALSNYQAGIGVRGGLHNEIAYCDVGGEPGRLAGTRAIWSIATERNYVHHNHVHHAASHALDFDAYTASSVAWANLCEDNLEEGIFVEETAHDNVVTGNTCRRNKNGIGVYSMAVGPVKRNVIFGNTLEANTNYQMTAGGYGHDPNKHSESNVFFGNVAGGVEPGGAAFNVAHGTIQGDYWFGNALEAGEDTRMEFDTDTLPHDNAAVGIFQPGGE